MTARTLAACVLWLAVAPLRLPALVLARAVSRWLDKEMQR